LVHQLVDAVDFGPFGLVERLVRGGHGREGIGVGVRALGRARPPPEVPSRERTSRFAVAARPVPGLECASPVPRRSFPAHTSRSAPMRSRSLILLPLLSLPWAMFTPAARAADDAN